MTRTPTILDVTKEVCNIFLPTSPLWRLLLSNLKLCRLHWTPVTASSHHIPWSSKASTISFICFTNHSHLNKKVLHILHVYPKQHWQILVTFVYIHPSFLNMHSSFSFFISVSPHLNHFLSAPCKAFLKSTIFLVNHDCPLLPSFTFYQAHFHYCHQPLIRLINNPLVSP